MNIAGSNDVERIINGFVSEGARILNRMNGQFILAIYDEEEKFQPKSDNFDIEERKRMGEEIEALKNELKALKAEKSLLSQQFDEEQKSRIEIFNKEDTLLNIENKEYSPDKTIGFTIALK